jgi:hypothetical protein
MHDAGASSTVFPSGTWEQAVVIPNELGDCGIFLVGFFRTFSFDLGWRA